MNYFKSQNSNLLINLVRVDPTPSIYDFIWKKTKNIFRRYPRLEGLKIDLKGETRGETTDYTARTRLVLPGYDRIIEKRDQDIFTAIAQVMEVADRQLRRRARLFKTKQRLGNVQAL